MLLAGSHAPLVLSLSAHLSQDPWEPRVPFILRVNHCDARAVLAHSVLSWLRMGLREKAAYTSTLNPCSSLPVKGTTGKGSADIESLSWGKHDRNSTQIRLGKKGWGSLTGRARLLPLGH